MQRPETTKITLIATLCRKVAIGRMILRTLNFLLNLFTVVDQYNDFHKLLNFLITAILQLLCGLSDQ